MQQEKTRLILIRASEWVSFKEVYKVQLLRNGAVPVNDVFFDLWHNNDPINLVYGSYGSGKSVFIATRLIKKCLTEKYFKCFYGRKVFDTVRNSLFATIVDVIEDLGLSHRFKYSKANTSSMVIECDNGNTFHPFGSDKAAKLKSIKDPTDIWAEEFDQFAQVDFELLFPRLRTTKGITQFWGTFNTAPVYENHWITKFFFPERLHESERNPIDILSNIRVNKTLANYTDNYFIDQEDYYQRLRLASGGNSNILEAIANGAWGVEENKSPWLYNFNYQVHVKDKLPFFPTFPVYLSFDFNNDPFACVAIQMSPHKGGKGSFVHILKEFSGMMKVEEMCERIKTTFPASILYVTGDRSGNNEDLGRNQTLYKMISGMLKLSKRQMNINTTNLEHADSRILCNMMFGSYPNMYIDAAGCPNLIMQCQRAKVDEKKPNPSALLKNREDHKNDEFDGMRYFFQTYFHEYMKNILRALKKPAKKAA